MFRPIRFIIIIPVVGVIAGHFFARDISFGAYILLMIFAISLGSAIGYVFDSAREIMSDAANIQSSEYSIVDDKEVTSGKVHKQDGGKEILSTRRLPSWISKYSRPF